MITLISALLVAAPLVLAASQAPQDKKGNKVVAEKKVEILSESKVKGNEAPSKNAGKGTTIQDKKSDKVTTAPKDAKVEKAKKISDDKEKKLK